jgi:hypothetical protein
MWSSVGSVGIVNTADIGKVVFIGAIAQLGFGIVGSAGPITAHLAERVRVPVPTETATIRYPVQAADFGVQAAGVSNLTVRYRDGNGSITVQLMQVAVETGLEEPIVTFQSGGVFPRSNTSRRKA